MVKITSFIRRSLTLWFALIAWIGGSLSGAARAYRLASLVAPSAKTVHRTVFFRILRMLPPCSNPLLPYLFYCFLKTKKQPMMGCFLWRRARDSKSGKRVKKRVKKCKKALFYCIFHFGSFFQMRKKRIIRIKF